MTTQQIENLEILITANASQLKKELGAVQGELKKFGNATSAMGSATSGSMAKMGAAAGLVGGAIAAVVTMVVDLAKKAVTALKDMVIASTKLAMAAIESETLVAVVFQEATQEIKDWSNELSNALGLNAYQLRKDAAMLYNISTGLGLTAQNAQTLAKGFTMLSRDMASFYEIPIEDAFAKLRSGITGETEPLRKLGVIITQTSIKMDAVRYGIAKEGEEMSEQQKILARYMSIMRQTNAVQGDLSRTMESPTNQLRIFRERIKQVGIEFGTLFIPILKVVLPYLVAFANVLMDAVRAIAAFFGIMGIQAMSNTQKLDGALEGVEESADNATGGVRKLKNELLGLAAFDEMNVLQQPSDSGSGGGGGGAGVGFSDFVLPDYNAGLEEFKSKVAALKDQVKDALGAIGGIIAGVLMAIAIVTGNPVAIILAVVAAFGLLFATSEDFRRGAGKLAGTIGDVLGAAFNFLKEVALTLWEILKPFVNFIGTVLGGVFTALSFILEPVIDILDLMAAGWAYLRVVLKPVFELIANYMEILGVAISALIQIIGALISGIWDMITPFKESILAKADSKRASEDLEQAEKDLLQAEEDLKEISGSVADAQLGLMDAKDRVTEATNKLTEAEAKYGAGSPQAVRAQLELESASGKLVTAEKRVIAETEKQTKAQQDVKTATENQKKATDDLQKANDRVNSTKAVSAADQMRTAFEKLSDRVNGIWDNMAGRMKIAINKVIDIYNRFRAQVNKVKLPDFLGGGGVNLPYITPLAKGGIVNSPTLSLLGEAGREAVVPLENNTEWIDQLASKLGGAGELHLTVKIGEDTVGEKIIEYINEKNMRTNLNTLNI